MGRWRALIPVTFALVISLAASLFLYKRLINPDKETKPSEHEAVAVAVEDLLLGAIIQPEMIKTAAYLKENLPPDFISDP
jgi:Flp pilus assembly protein CpaB